MFGITTFMFALGIIALVLETMMGFRIAEPDFTISHSDNFYARYYYVWATITCLMVRLRLRDAFMPSD
jgi:hypothetical protein